MKEVVHIWQEAFEKVDRVIARRMPNVSTEVENLVTRASLLLERLTWPVVRPKVGLLRETLDRLKATLLPMPYLLIFAWMVVRKVSYQ